MPRTSARTRHPLAQAPLDELAAELARRKGSLPKLQDRRDRLRAELEQLDAQILMLESLDGGGTTSKKTRGDAKSGKTRSTSSTLREKIGKVLGAEPMRPVEIASALVDQGLHGGSKSLAIQVSSTLAKFDDFSKIARGQWVHVGPDGNDRGKSRG